MSVRSLRNRVTPFPEAVPDLSAHTLVIGDLARWTAEGRIDASLDAFRFVDISTLSAELASNAQPGVILSPLIANEFDAIDVAMLLVNSRFRGKYIVVTEGVPDPALILSEVKTAAGELDFDLIQLPMAM